MIKKLSTLVAGLALICLTGCTSPQKGTAQNDVFSPIEVAVPERPAGQQDVIQLTTPKLDTVRVGFIGLGMRGPGAVERWTHIPGTKIGRTLRFTSRKCRKSTKNRHQCRNGSTGTVFRFGRCMEAIVRT